jgi:prophage tail gpP-like protein
VTVGEELVLTGRVKDVAPTADAGSSSVGVTVYSLAYDLTEVCAPVESWPLAFNGFDLRQIADRLVTPTLGIATVIDGQPGATFAKVSCEPDSTIHSVLADLALQRGYVLSDLPTGDLLFRSEAFTGAPVARLQGQPLGRVSAQFQPGSWYGRITGRASQKAGQSGSQFTAINPLYRAENPRSITISVDDSESADIPAAVRAAIGRMIASVATYTVEGLPGWRDPSGALWRPNTTITLTAPEAMIYRETELLIRSVKLNQTAEVETASLELVMPGSFGGFLSLELPWVS